MRRVVVDTGVIVSAAFRDRTPEELILFLVGNEDFEWIVSPPILEEYNEVLARTKFDLPPRILQKWREIFEQCTTIVNLGTEIEFPRDQVKTPFPMEDRALRGQL